MDQSLLSTRQDCQRRDLPSVLLPSHGSPSQPVDDLDRVRRLYLQANGSQRGLSFWCRERYVPDVRYLLVQKYDDSTFLFALE